MTERKYEEGLYRCYVAGGDQWDSPEGQTHYLEYDRDEQAERDVRFTRAIMRVVLDHQHEVIKELLARLGDPALIELNDRVHALEKEAENAVQDSR